MVKSYLTKRQPIPLPEDLAETSVAAMGLPSSEAGQATSAGFSPRRGAFLLTMPSSSICQRLCDVD